VSMSQVKSLKSEGDLFKEREREKLSLVGKKKDWWCDIWVGLIWFDHLYNEVFEN